MFAKRLNNLRKKYKYSQSTIAKYMNVSQVSISYWERGIKEPSFQELIDLSNLFNVSTDYLLGKSNKAD